MARDLLKDPFGKPDCEEEVHQLKDKYSEIYFDETPFTSPAIFAGCGAHILAIALLIVAA